MSVTVVRAPAGGGKTTAFAERIAFANKDWRIEVYVPTHALAMEWKGLIKKLNPKCVVHVIGGRNHKPPGGAPLCNRHQVAAQISKAGQSVYSRLCRSILGEQCKTYFDCPYINQFQYGHVFIYTHAYLPLERGMLDMRIPEMVVIDESFFAVCLQKVAFDISLLRHQALTSAATALCGDIAALLQSGASLYPRIALARKRGGGLHGAIKALRTSAPKPSPDQSDQLVIQTLQSAPNFEPVALLLEHLGRAFASKQTLQSVVYDVATGNIQVHHRQEITRFKPNSAKNPPPKIYLLDATASQEITRVFFPDAKFKEICVKRKAFVVQCRSSICSTRSLTQSAHASPASASGAAQKLAEVQQLIDDLSGGGKNLLVVAPTAITGNPGKSILPIVQVPAGSALAHFSALRGVDLWKDFDTVLVIGRNEPPPEAIEDMARALFYDDADPLILTGQRRRVPRGYRLASMLEGVDVDVHHDDRVQAILEQVRESESLQAVDRLRLIHCDEPKLVVLLSNIPLDLDVDALLTWDELIHGTRLERAFRATRDVLPLSPDWLTANFSQFWPTAAAAKKDVQRQSRKGHFTNSWTVLSSLCRSTGFLS